VLSVVLDQYWIDIGTPQKYLEVHHDILSRRFSSPRVSASALDRASLPQGALVDSKSIIGPDVTIRPGVRIENSVIGKNCKIDEGAQVIDSVVWAGNTIDAEARVLHSIIGKGCSIGRSAIIGAGAVLGDKTVITDFSTL
jgi:NDP-sugar pyrophosphorylase family protein